MRREVEANHNGDNSYEAGGSSEGRPTDWSPNTHHSSSSSSEKDLSDESSTSPLLKVTENLPIGTTDILSSMSVDNNAIIFDSWQPDTPRRPTDMVPRKLFPSSELTRLNGRLVACDPVSFENRPLASDVVLLDD